MQVESHQNNELEDQYHQNVELAIWDNPQNNEPAVQFDSDTFLKFKFSSQSALNSAYQYLDDSLNIIQATLTLSIYGVLLNPHMELTVTQHLTPYLPEIFISMRLISLLIELKDYKNEKDLVIKVYKRDKLVKSATLFVFVAMLRILFKTINVMKVVHPFLFIAMATLSIIFDIAKIISLKNAINNVQNEKLMKQYSIELRSSSLNLFSNVCFLAFACGVLALGISTGSLGVVFVVAGILSVAVKMVNSHLNKVNHKIQPVKLFQPDNRAGDTSVELESEEKAIREEVIAMITKKISNIEYEIENAGLIDFQKSKRIQKYSALSDLRSLLYKYNPGLQEKEKFEESVQEIIKKNPNVFKAMGDSETYLIFNLVMKSYLMRNEEKNEDVDLLPPQLDFQA